MAPNGPPPPSIASRTLIAAAVLVLIAIAAVAYLRWAPLEGAEDLPVSTSTSTAASAEVAPAPVARPDAVVTPSLPSARLATSPEPEPPPPGGEATGIAAFPPPGTKRLKRGIVVPEDFQLPE